MSIRSPSSCDRQRGCQLEKVRWVIYASQTFLAFAHPPFDRRLTKARAAALVDLAYAFNAMNEDLERSTQPLDDNTRSLERKIAERTEALEREIQARQRIEAELRASERRYRLLYEGTQDSVILLESGPPYCFNDCNAATLTMFGVANKTDFCRLNPACLSPPVQPDGSSSTIAAQERIERAIERGTCNFEWLHCRADTGEPFYAEVWLTAVDIEGAIRVMATIRDITARKQTQLALEASEAEYRTLIEAANCIILRWTPDGRIRFINHYGQQFFGYDEADLVGMSITEIIPESNRSQFDWDAYLADLTTCPEAHKIREHPNVRQNGEIVWVVWANQPVFDGEGRLLEGLSVGTDATARKRAEEQLRKSEERWQLALQGNNDGIWDLDFRTGEVFVSERCREMVGYRESELPNRLEAWTDLIHPDEREAVLGAFQDHLNGQTDCYSVEYRRRCRDGSYKWILDRGKALWDEAGNPVRMVGSHTDITERKQAEEKLRKSEERWQMALDGSNDGIWDWDLTVDYCFLSERCLEMLGYSANEINSFQKWASVFHPDDLDRIREVLDRHLRKEAPHYSCEYRARHKNGTYRWILARGKAVWNDSGIPIRMVGSLTDITDRKQAEEALRHAKEMADAANQAKSQFIANMSHELRTPLNGILGYTQIFQRLDDLPPNLENGVRVIHQCGTHLLALIEDILDFAKLEAHRMTLSPALFHLATFVDRVGDLFEFKASQKDLTFQQYFDPQLPIAVYADKKRLRQVLMELLGNAVKFTESGSVTLRVSLVERLEASPETGAASRIRFEVEDTGIGMKPEQLERVFLPFEQVRDADRQSEGTGLGLTIAQKIVQMMGGNLNVRSHFGQGSQFGFELLLPERSDGQLPDIARPLPRVVRGYRGRKRKILVVDDNWESRTAAVELLRSVGFDIIEASHGREALELATADPPDGILTDLVMPVMDGFELIRQIRQQPTLQTVPIFAASASPLTPGGDLGTSVDCNGVLSKPLQASELFATFEQHLQVDWIYSDDDDDSESPSTPSPSSQSDRDRASEDDRESDTIVPPPPEILETLRHLARRGSLKRSIEQARELAERDPQLRPFADKLETLARTYQDKALLEFLDRYYL
ncbi:Circadian input kinase A [Geitlerinema sp. FC II]|nr:Circadian input kinase A [Geitlerinema sp. FC II]